LQHSAVLAVRLTLWLARGAAYALFLSSCPSCVKGRPPDHARLPVSGYGHGYRFTIYSRLQLFPIQSMRNFPERCISSGGLIFSGEGCVLVYAGGNSALVLVGTIKPCPPELVRDFRRPVLANRRLCESANGASSEEAAVSADSHKRRVGLRSVEGPAPLLCSILKYRRRNRSSPKNHPEDIHLENQSGEGRRREGQVGSIPVGGSPPLENSALTWQRLFATVHVKIAISRPTVYNRHRICFGAVRSDTLVACPVENAIWISLSGFSAWTFVPKARSLERAARVGHTHPNKCSPAFLGIVWPCGCMPLIAVARCGYG